MDHPIEIHPVKINIFPKNHPFATENHLPKLPFFYLQHVNFQRFSLVHWNFQAISWLKPSPDLRPHFGKKQSRPLHLNPPETTKKPVGVNTFRGVEFLRLTFHRFVAYFKKRNTHLLQLFFLSERNQIEQWFHLWTLKPMGESTRHELMFSVGYQRIFRSWSHKLGQQFRRFLISRPIRLG